MSRYSGTADIEFVVERYRHPISLNIMSEEDGDDETDSYEHIEVTLNVEGSSYFTPGRYSGPPENCYPDEGETEITSVVDDKGNDWMNLLTDSEKERIKELIIEAVQESDDDDYDGDSDDYDDSSVDFVYDP